jgi:ubiquinone/menaquinone biosynthesis C-methylase UbiE
MGQFSPAKKFDQGRLQDIAIGYYASQTLHAAVELEVFTKLAGKRSTVAEASKVLGLHPRPTEKLLNACVALDLLEIDNGQYYNSPLAENFLVKGKLGYYGHYVSMMVEQFYDSWSMLKEALIRNQPVTDFFPEKVHKDEKTAQKFTTAVHDSANSRAEALLSDPALDFSEANNMLDIGCGSGGMAIAFAQKYPHLEIVIFDMPTVCEVAKQFISQSAAQDRIKLWPGNFLEDELPKGFDIVVIANVFHILGADECQYLLDKAFLSLNPGGLIVILDVLMNDDKRGPFMPALFALTMFLITRNGATYSGAEIKQWLQEKGFRDIHQRPLTGPYALVLGRK